MAPQFVESSSIDWRHPAPTAIEKIADVKPPAKLSSDIDLRVIFSIFYAVLFGCVLSSLYGLRLFQWGDLINQPYASTFRLVIGIFIFNIGPILLFAHLYNLLPSSLPSSSAFSITIPAVMSLAVFSFYRLYHVFLSFTTFRNFLYSTKEQKLPDIEKRLSDIPTGWVAGLKQFVSTMFYILALGHLPLLLYKILSP